MLGFQTPWNPFYLVRQAPLIPQRHTAKDTEFLTQIWHSDTIRCTKIERKICEKLSVFNIFWIERCPPKAEVRGSNPLGCAIPHSRTRRMPTFFLSFLRRVHIWGYNGQTSTVSVPETWHLLPPEKSAATARSEAWPGDYPQVIAHHELSPLFFTRWDQS